ncbi:MAG: glycyl-radical enzyme activating protein [Candidatus Latescibacterota bacterium]
MTSGRMALGGNGRHGTPAQVDDTARSEAGAQPPGAPGTGVVLNLQRFSTHDGPGIRTTVFLKGCTNSCAWCHNPESLRLGPELQVYPDRCIGCGRCFAVCPHGCHEMDGRERVYHRQRCAACGRCAAECFAGALVMAGRTLSVEQVMAEVLADRTYYRHSGGGATFSGGEPLLQRAFLQELLQACGREGVHTPVETAGGYPWSWLEPVLPFVNLVMYDLKILDPDLHAAHVGNDGRRIRANLEELSRTGVPLIVRTPVIGGVNDTDEEIAGMARLIGGYQTLLYYELLPYHPLGLSKRRSLGLPVDDPFHAPGKTRLAELAEAARAFVREVRA